ncbi:hypothetical protein M0805_007606 [Coniferiporia weirii]|nr:hypothetical protein M0805_007606 [Coniferiporia weirii]
MSTATSTTTTSSQMKFPSSSASLQMSGAMPLNAYPSSSSSTPSATSPNSNTGATSESRMFSSASTLRSLYPRAARALLRRDIALTHTLLASAFALLTPPTTLASPDALDLHRRKWYILRITLETSVYALPPASNDPEELPASLRANLMLSAQSLIATLHARSVRLFTPQTQNPKSAYLPAQILVTLVLSSLKLHCPDAGRSMVEDWLAQRESVENVRDDAEGYGRVVELFCLHLLPRLQDWEYAGEFLEYERELPPQTRQSLQRSLKAIRNQEIEAARSIPTPPPPSNPSTPGGSSSSLSRLPSPAPSTASSSSTGTDDTHSTRTIVPHTSRLKRGANGISALTPTPATSSSRFSDMKHANGFGNGHATRGKRSPSPASTVHAGPPTARRSRVSTDSESEAAASQRAVSARSPPSAYALIKTSLRPLFARLSSSQIVFAVLFVLVPVLSFVLRRRRRRMAGAELAGTGADEVRRRLALRPDGSRVGMLSVVWWELSRAVADAVRMAGSGLV